MDLFRFKESSVLCKPLVSSDDAEECKAVKIPSSKLKWLQNYHILGIEFLLQKYQDKSPGAILNEEYGLNTQLQVSVFLNIMFNIIKRKFLVLLLCPNNLLPVWHYHLTNHGGLKVLIIDNTGQNVQEDPCTVHLVPFSRIRQFEDLIKCDYSIAIIDHFDVIANERIVGNINTGFNLSLTNRNFYDKPDQKLQWIILNWCVPGCAGKLSDFYKRDNENLLNFRDNYKHWWFRLTWNFYETYRKPTEADIKAYNDKISHWTVSQKLTRHNIITCDVVSNQTSKRKHVARRKGGKKLKGTNSKQVEQKNKGNINILPDGSNLDSTVCNDVVKCTQKTKQKEINEAEKMNEPEQTFEVSNSDSTIINCPSTSYTLLPKTQDHELFLSLLNPNVKPEKREINVSTEVEEILKKADELLS